MEIDCFSCRHFTTPQQSDGYAVFWCEKRREFVSDDLAVFGCDDWITNEVKDEID